MTASKKVPLRMLPSACVADAIEAALHEIVVPTFGPLLHAVTRRNDGFAMLVDDLADNFEVCSADITTNRCDAAFRRL